jgi:hypothetical protein
VAPPTGIVNGNCICGIVTGKPGTGGGEPEDGDETSGDPPKFKVPELPLLLLLPPGT